MEIEGCFLQDGGRMKPQWPDPCDLLGGVLTGCMEDGVPTLEEGIGDCIGPMIGCVRNSGGDAIPVLVLEEYNDIYELIDECCGSGSSGGSSGEESSGVGSSGSSGIGSSGASSGEPSSGEPSSGGSSGISSEPSSEPSSEGSSEPSSEPSSSGASSSGGSSSGTSSEESSSIPSSGEGSSEESSSGGSSSGIASSGAPLSSGEPGSEESSEVLLPGDCCPSVFGGSIPKYASVNLSGGGSCYDGNYIIECIEIGGKCTCVWHGDFDKGPGCGTLGVGLILGAAATSAGGTYFPGDLLCYCTVAEGCKRSGSCKQPWSSCEVTWSV